MNGLSSTRVVASLLTMLTLASLGAGTAIAGGWSSFENAFPALPCQDGWAACRTDAGTTSAATVKDAAGRLIPSDLRVGWFDLQPTANLSPFVGLSAYEGPVGGAVAQADPPPQNDPPRQPSTVASTGDGGNTDAGSDIRTDRGSNPTTSTASNPSSTASTSTTSSTPPPVGNTPTASGSGGSSMNPNGSSSLASNTTTTTSTSSMNPNGSSSMRPTTSGTGGSSVNPNGSSSMASNTTTSTSTSSMNPNGSSSMNPAKQSGPVTIASNPTMPAGTTTTPVANTQPAAIATLPTDNSCNDLVKIEPSAMLGGLSAGQIDCLEKRVGSEPLQTTRDKVSRLLISNAENKGDKSGWERLMKRHLEDIDRSDPDMCFKYALHLSRGGVGRAQGVIRWADYALENKAKWSGNTYKTRVFSLYKLRAEAANKLWQDAEDNFMTKEHTDENEAKAAKFRGSAKDFAREWLDYAKASDQDTKTAMALCVSASGNRAFCEGG